MGPSDFSVSSWCLLVGGTSRSPVVHLNLSREASVVGLRVDGSLGIDKLEILVLQPANSPAERRTFKIFGLDTPVNDSFLGGHRLVGSVTYLGEDVLVWEVRPRDGQYHCGEDTNFAMLRDELAATRSKLYALEEKVDELRIAREGRPVSD